ncbi:iron ABC transporter permease [Klenkia sp. LSe6-5]|uniref:Iron ABC transporter permease n=1 Tax=Klenkia sesuvii TaxID=3103137 RepID=A0ABU8DUT8_9ACTN
MDLPPPVAGLAPARVTGSVAPAPSAPARDVAAADRSARRRYRRLLLTLLVASPVVLVLAAGAGAVPIPPADVLAVLRAHLLGGPVGEPVVDQIIWQVRVPRVLLAFVVGAALAVAGAVLQAVVRNPLAEPYVLGVSAGASLAAVAVLTLGGLTSGTALASLGVPGAAFLGALATLVAVVALGRRAGRLDPARLLLAGVALSYLLQAATSWLQLRSAPNQLAAVLFWLLGTVGGADWGDLALPTAVLVLATTWLVLQGRSLNALLAGDDVAASLGVAADRVRLQLLVVAAALTAVVISVAGGVGFVGLVAPHCVRLLVGPEHRRLLPATALLGGAFLVLADLVGRLVAAPLELPLNVVTAVAGVPFFLVLLRRSTRIPGGGA